MILEHFLLSVNETNCYVVACTQTGEAAVIDPGEWNGQLAGFVNTQKLSLKWILLTHGHSDHTSGIEALKASSPGIQIAAHGSSESAERKLAEGDSIKIGKLTVRVFETPGHTQDSLSFVLGCNVFCGDALFAGSVGGTSNRMEFEQLIQSIQRKALRAGRRYGRSPRSRPGDDRAHRKAVQSILHGLRKTLERTTSGHRSFSPRAGYLGRSVLYPVADLWERRVSSGSPCEFRSCGDRGHCSSGQRGVG